VNLDSPDCPEGLTAAQLAPMLGLSVDTLYELARRNAIPHLRFTLPGAKHGRVLFPRRALIRWLESCEAHAELAGFGPLLRAAR
jgi:excisionase family DNA binding protein